MDRSSRRVYQYDAAAGLTTGTRSASTSFALASGNTNPQGIADPPTAVSLTPVQPEPSRTQSLASGPIAPIFFPAKLDESERPFSGQTANWPTTQLVDEAIAGLAGRPGVVGANLLSELDAFHELVLDVAATITRRKTARSDFWKLDENLLEMLGKLNQ